MATTTAPAAPVATKLPTYTLYLGDLAPETSENDLFQVFQSVAPVSSVKVCRDHATRKSLGYGYINFQSIEDAERVLSQMNYTVINGRQCRLQFVQRDASVRKNAAGNLVVKRLGPAITSKMLHEAFAEFGEILSCKVACLPDGTSKGYGFVHMKKEEDAEKARSIMDGLELAGAKVVVERYVPPKERAAGKDQWTNVYAKNLPREWNEAKLREEFSQFGAISSVFLATQPSGESKGFGFVGFSEHSAAAAAVAAMHEKEVPGSPVTRAAQPAATDAASGAAADGSAATPAKTCKLYVSKAVPRPERERQVREQRDHVLAERNKKWASCNLYVRNIDDSCDEEQLRKLFTPYGTIASAKVERDEKGNSRNFGYVLFANPDEATKAQQAMHHHMVNGKPLYVRFWQAKAERQQENRNRVEQAAARPGATATTVATAAPAGAAAGTVAAGINPGAIFSPQQLHQFLAMVTQQIQTTKQSMLDLQMQQAQQARAGAPVNPQVQATLYALQQQLQYQVLQAAVLQSWAQGYNPLAAVGAAQPGQMLAAPAGMAVAGQPAAAGHAGAAGARGRGRGAAAGGYTTRGGAAAGRGGMRVPQAGPVTAGVPVPEAAAAPVYAMVAGAPVVAAPVAGAADMHAAMTQQPATYALMQRASTANSKELLELLKSVPHMEKQLLGMRLLPEVTKIDRERARKVVGMLTSSLSTSDLLEMLDTPSLLQQNVTDALNALNQQAATATAPAAAAAH